MDKELLKNEIENKTLSKKSYNYLFKVTIVKNLILGFILFLILLFSILNHSKLVRFFSLKSEYDDINLFLYYFIIVISLTLPLGTAIYNLINIVKNKEWTTKAYKIYNILDLPQFIVISLSLLLFIINNIITTCDVSGTSMEPNYYDDDKLLVWCLKKDYSIDDVVIFDSTSYDYESSFYIKRVVASENDTVKYDNVTKKLYVNDNFVEYLSLEEYLNIISSLDNDYTLTMLYEFIIPEDKLLVFGDNRDVSRDSRIIGLIDERDVLGKAIFRLFPFEDFGVVR